jgi:hypothetical protein
MGKVTLSLWSNVCRSGQVVPLIPNYGTRWRWVISFTPWLIYPPAGWAADIVWTLPRREKSLVPKENRTTILRCSPYSLNHCTDWGIPEMSISEFCLDVDKITCCRRRVGRHRKICSYRCGYFRSFGQCDYDIMELYDTESCVLSGFELRHALPYVCIRAQASSQCVRYVEILWG